MPTPKDCPGFDKFKGLASFLCKCPECDEEIEVFSDEFEKEHKCPKCSKLVDFTKCSLYSKS